MKNKLLFISFFATIFFSLSANADTTPDLTVLGVVSDALKKASVDELIPMAMTWAGGFIFLQFLATQLKVLTSGGDATQAWAKAIGSFLWAGFCVYVVSNGPNFINNVGQGILSKFGSGVGLSAVLASTLTLSTAIFGIMLPINTLNSAGGQLLLIMGIGVLFSGVYLIVKIFMLQLELGLIVMLAPLSFSFLGMNALRDQGIAPLKSLISLAYRIILIGVISGGFKKVIDVAVVDIAAVSVLQPFQAVATITGVLSAFPILVFLLFKSDAIAASLAGGHTSMSASDVGGAAMAGAALGGAAGGAASVVKSGMPLGMSGALGNMMGGGAGSVSNGGSGGRPLEPRIDPPPPRSPSSSLSSNETFAQAKAAFNSGSSSAPGSSSTAGAGNTAWKSPASPRSTVVSPDAQCYPTQSQSTGNAADAGIGGSSGGNQTSAPRQQDSLGQRLKDLNQHVAQEKAATHVSINSHAGD